MHAYVISDSEPIAQRVREGILRSGLECSDRGTIRLDMALDLKPTQNDLVVMVLAPDAERALSTLTLCKAQCPCPILAVGPTTDSRYVLRALRGGADDFIDEAEFETEFAA